MAPELRILSPTLNSEDILMLATSEITGGNTAPNAASLASPTSPEIGAEPGTDAGIYGGDKIMMWLLTGFFVLLGGIVISEFVLKAILGIRL